MGRVLRLTTIMGLVAGAWSLPAILPVLPFLVLAIPAIFIDPFLIVASVFFLTPVVSVSGSILLLARPWTLEQRGIIGYVTFISSLLSVLVGVLFRAWTTS